MRRVTFSRNYTISLSRTCQCYCKYCAFATHQAHIYSPEEVDAQLEQAVRRNAKELLILGGDALGRDVKGEAAIHFGARAGMVPLVEFLIARGGEPDF